MTTITRGVTRRWRHEGGMETVETIAVVGVAAALLVAVMLVLSANGGSVGGAAVGRFVSFIQGPVAGQAAPTQVGEVQTVAYQPPLTVVAMGVPAMFQAAPAAQGSNVLANLWNSMPLWLQGGLIALGAAVVVGAIFVGLVALGVVTVVSAPVALVIAAVGAALAFVVGAIYAIVTGKIDVVQLLLIGAGVQLLTIGVALFVMSGAAAATIAWVRTVAWPWITRGVSTAWSWITRQATRLGGWLWNTARPAVWRAVTWPFRAGWRVATRLWGWTRNTAAPWLWNKITWPFRAGWRVATRFWKFIRDKQAVEAFLKKRALQIAMLSRIIEELAKGSYTEGLIYMLAITVIETLMKGNPIAYLVTLLAWPLLKGLYSRFKDDIHKWLRQHAPWLPLPKLP